MFPQLLERSALVALFGMSLGAQAQVLTPFATASLTPAFSVNGAGTNVDSIAFWEAPDPDDTLMFVTGKNNDLVEVWKFPFAGNELPHIQFAANVNGVAIDQQTDLLYVSDRVVSVFSLPDLQLQSEFGEGIIGVGENNLDILKHASGETWIYVSEDHELHRFNAATSALLGSFAPPVVSIETVLADDFYQRILVPEEQGSEGNTGVLWYTADGTPFEMGGTNRFGNDGEFDADEEGILLYTFPAAGIGDDGTGFIVVSDQRGDVTDFEVFDRQSWTHLGKFRLTGVSNTDGIASTQLALPGYPLGVFAAIDDDSSTAGIGWDAIFTAIGWNLAPEAVRITPTTVGPTTAESVEFTVQFSEPVSGFDTAADLIITHDGTASTGAAITGSGASYSVTVIGISGAGSLTLAISTPSDILDTTSKTLAFSVTSPPVAIGTLFEIWAARNGLTSGIDDGFEDDPDGDQLFNIVEFATDGDPLDSVASAKTGRSFVETGGDRFFAYTFPVRDGAVFSGAASLSAIVDGIMYRVSGTGDLSNFDERVLELATPRAGGLPPPNAGWSYRTFQLSKPVAELPSAFIRLTAATEPP